MPGPSGPDFIIPANPVYDPNIASFDDKDRAHASSVVNPLLQKMFNNIHALKLQADELEGGPGTPGLPGATFTPAVSNGGDLSWSNNGGLPNPPTVNIRGPQGESSGSGGAVDLPSGLVLRRILEEGEDFTVYRDGEFGEHAALGFSFAQPVGPQDEFTALMRFSFEESLDDPGPEFEIKLTFSPKLSTARVNLSFDMFPQDGDLAGLDELHVLLNGVSVKAEWGHDEGMDSVLMEGWANMSNSLWSTLSLMMFMIFTMAEVIWIEKTEVLE
jgi:hypothetical protein